MCPVTLKSYQNSYKVFGGIVEPTGHCQLPSGTGLPHSLNFMLSGPPAKDFIYFVCMSVFCLCVCTSTTCGQKRMLALLQLGLQMVLETT